MATNSEYPAFVGSYLPMRVEQTVSFVPDGQLALPEKMSDDVRRAIADKYCCKVCENIPDEDGFLEHGKGCYTQSEDGGGSEWICEYTEEIMRHETQQMLTSTPTADEASELTAALANVRATDIRHYCEATEVYRSGDKNKGPCVHCGNPVVAHYPRWTCNPAKPDAKPIHDECFIDFLAILEKQSSLDRDCEAFWAIQDALTGWSIVAVHPHMIYRAGLVLDLERGGEKKTVAIFQDGSNAPMQLDTGK